MNGKENGIEISTAFHRTRLTYMLCRSKNYVKFVSHPTERDTKMLLILGIYGGSVFNYYNLIIY